MARSHSHLLAAVALVLFSSLSLVPFLPLLYGPNRGVPILLLISKIGMGLCSYILRSGKDIVSSVRFSVPIFSYLLCIVFLEMLLSAMLVHIIAHLSLP